MSYDSRSRLHAHLSKGREPTKNKRLCINATNKSNKIPARTSPSVMETPEIISFLYMIEVHAAVNRASIFVPKHERFERVHGMVD